MPEPARILQDAYDNVRREYCTAIGQRRDELITPALVLDIDAAQRNIDHMASELKQMGAATIRPHYKTHKSPDLARRQLRAGAGGLSMATVWEAAILAAAGMDDLFVVNTVAHPAKLRVLAELARDHRVLVAVDEAANAAAQAPAAIQLGAKSIRSSPTARKNSAAAGMPTMGLRPGFGAKARLDRPQPA